MDRVGADSFQPDHGVMISKSKRPKKKNDPEHLYQWVIDANPQDIGLLDFYRPDGTPVYVPVDDPRQLADALFHAGTRSGSEYEFVDEANALHFYIIDTVQVADDVLTYTTAVRSLDAGASDPHERGVAVEFLSVSSPAAQGVSCSFQVLNTGVFVNQDTSHPDKDVIAHLAADVYRLTADVTGDEWTVELPNALVTADFDESVTVKVAARPTSSSASLVGVVNLTVTSESDPNVSASASCSVERF